LKIGIIAAISENNIIGKNGTIPWHSKEDFRHFKKTTMGFPIIMGRKTFASIGKPLPGRLNIVITSRVNSIEQKENLIAFPNLNKALDYCRQNNYLKVFIIGGEQLYRAALPVADFLVLTRMKLVVDGDKFFPPVNMENWRLTSRDERDDFVIEYFERLKKELNVE